MKKIFISSVLGVSCALSSFGSGTDLLRFDPDNFRMDSISMPSGETVRFKAYEGICYVRNAEDPAYQQLNIYVPVRLRSGAAGAPSTEYTDYVIDVDWVKYLTYVARQRALKTPPAFDAYGVLNDAPTPENQVFGDREGKPDNFTDFSLRKRTGDLSATLP